MVLQIQPCQNGLDMNRIGRTRLLYNVAPHAMSVRPAFELSGYLQVLSVLTFTLRCDVMRVRATAVTM